jgi:serine/threonine-protein kinase
VALAIADGLSFAHQRGLVHRDVKPQNVLLNKDGDVKVTDFGIARSLHVEHGVTQTGTVLGTGEYLAPEQASGKPVSAATDVYSLGVVLWELLAGDVPFTGENFVAVALRHVNELPADLRERRPDVSPRLAAAVDRALAKDPARRFPSMAAFAKELRACLAELDGTVSAPPPPVDEAALTMVTPPVRAPAQAPARRRTRRRRRSTALYVLLALVVAGAAFAAVLLLGGSSHHGGGSSGGGGGPTGTTVSLQGVGDAYSAPGHPDSHADTASLATDGSASTSWMTQTYGDQAFGGLLTGLGLVLDAGSSVKLTQMTVATPTPGFTAEIQVGNSPNGPFSADSSSQTVSNSTTFDLQGKSGQYYTVWITELPPGGSAQISEVTAKS